MFTDDDAQAVLARFGSAYFSKQANVWPTPLRRTRNGILPSVPMRRTVACGRASTILCEGFAKTMRCSNPYALTTWSSAPSVTTRL